jgi:glyoxylase-like metal-dependent hydrolase (beta-lactamase superfamily II)
VIACEATAVRFQGDVQADLERRRSAAEPGVLDRVELVAPTITFRASHRIDLGGATLELHELPGHTRDCIVGLVPEWGVLLAGDTVETPLPVVNDGAAVPKWIQQLDRWTTDSRIATVVPSHGRVGGRELIEETTGYLRTLLPEPAGVDHAAGGAWDLSAFPPFYAMTHERNRRRMSERG